MIFLNKKIFLWLVPAIVLMFFLTPAVSGFLKINNYPAIALFWIIILLSFASAVNGGIINGWQKFKDASWIGILGAFVKIFSGIFLVKIGLQLNGIIGGFVLSILMTYLLTFYALRFIFKNYRQNKSSSGKNLDFKSIKAYVIPVLFGNLALTVFGNIDMVLAKHNLSAEIAGQYGALTIVSKIIFFATGIIGTVLFSMAAEKNHRDGNALPILKNAIWLIATICLFSVLAYFSVPKLIMGMLFGSRYADIIGYLGWFAILASLFSIVNLITQYLLSVHATRFVTSYLILAGFLCIWILVAGSQIFAILKMMITGEVMALILGLYYLKKQLQQYGQIDLNYNPNL